MAETKTEHRSYMTRWGRDWRVYHWDESVGCYRESHSMSYWVARASVGDANRAARAQGAS